MHSARRLAAILLVALAAACGDSGGSSQGLTADEIPIAYTPAGGFRETLPEPVLARCTEPLVAGAPDLRGLWRAVYAERMGAPVAADDRIYAYLERVEQCGNRIVDMGGGTIADARADGTEENAVHDVSAFDFTTPLVVIATYESGVFVLRPAGIPGIEVTRRLDADGHMIWTRPDRGGLVVTLERDGDGAGTPVNTFFPYQPNAPAP
ncbi:MAG: hypothetical protein U0842_27945 [Candidatus Binatia bacterium]